MQYKYILYIQVNSIQEAYILYAMYVFAHIDVCAYSHVVVDHRPTVVGSLKPPETSQTRQQRCERGSWSRGCADAGGP